MKLSLIDFKSHANEDFKLEGDVVITGKNGEGKTSVLEGIIFTLFGRNFYGKIATDVFVKEGAPCATAILEMDGTEIKRTVGSENATYLNGTKSKVAEVGSLFPPLETALPIINPLYFMYEMTDSDKRELFMKLLPGIDREEIFKKEYSKRKDMVDRFKSSRLSEVREQIRNSETILKANASQIATYQLDIKGDEDEVKQIKANMPENPKGVLKREKEVQKEIEQTQKELAKLGNPNARIKEYQEELEGFKKEAQPIVDKLEVKSISQALEKLDSGIEDMTQKVEDLKESLTKNKVVLEQLKEFEDGKCPLCKQPVTGADERLEEVKARVQKEKVELVDLKEKLNKYENIRDMIQDLKDNVTRCVNGIAIHEKKVPKYDKLNDKIDELEKELAGNTKQDFQDALEVERAKEAIRIVQNAIMRKKGTITRLKETNEKLENDLPDLKVLEEALSPKGVEAHVAKHQAKEIEKLIKPYMELEVETVQENKTNDNTREVFEVTRKGVSFRSMSFGERIKVSVAFGLVLRELARGFNLDFVLLDEASVLSKDSLEDIKEWLHSKDVNLVYTRATEDKLKVVSNGD